jgi:hypothetical protein
VTDGVFVPAADHAGCDAPPTFLAARPITPYDLTALTERVRRRVVRWFCMQRLLAAAADMLAWENSGFSVDASVRITLLDRDVPSRFQSLEHLLRYCARPPFALERLSVIRDADSRIARIRYVMPRHKAANWVGPGRKRKSTQPGRTASSSSRRLSSSIGSWISFHSRGNTGTGITASSLPIARCGRPSRLWRSATSASSAMS